MIKFYQFNRNSNQRLKIQGKNSFQKTHNQEIPSMKFIGIFFIQLNIKLNLKKFIFIIKK